MEEIKFKIKPKYNFIYELGMPTGTKVKNAFIAIVFMSIIYILTFFINFESSNNSNSILTKSLDLSKVLPYVQNIFLILIIILILIFIVKVVLQILQYKNTYYTFYKDKVIYEDLFLNQKKKSLLYSNVKEIEIRRSIWDRLNRRGIIIIYTNAEKSVGNGMVVYSIKDVKSLYDNITTLVNEFNHVKDKSGNITDVNASETYLNSNNINSYNDVEQDTQNITTDEEERAFKDSLKN